MNNRQKIFVEEYLKSFNAADAARKAGYSERTARAIGAENLTKPDIAAAIRARLDERAMSADEVLDRLADQARNSIDDFLDDDGRLDLLKARAAGKLHLVKKLSSTQQGTTIELYDAQAALALLGRTHKLFVDRSENVNRNTTIEVVEEIVDVETDDPAAPGASGVPAE